MILTDARRISRQAGPFTSMTFVSSSTDTGSARRARLRAAVASLIRQGAPDPDVQAVLRSMEVRPASCGRGLRVIVIRAGRVEFDRVLVDAAGIDSQMFGPAPNLVPLVRASRWPVPYIVVDIDAAEARMEVVDGAAAMAGLVTFDFRSDLAVEGICRAHRGAGDAASERERRTCLLLASAISRRAAAAAAVAVFLAGEPHVVRAVTAHLERQPRPVATVRLAAQRSESSVSARDSEIARVLTGFVNDQRRRIAEQVRCAGARAIGRSVGLRDVTAALRSGLTDRVVMQDRRTRQASLWTGTAPLEIGVGRSDVWSRGAAAPALVRADVALTRAALASGCDIAPIEDDLLVADGVAALHRWQPTIESDHPMPTLMLTGIHATGNLVDPGFGRLDVGHHPAKVLSED